MQKKHIFTLAIPLLMVGAIALSSCSTKATLPTPTRTLQTESSFLPPEEKQPSQEPKVQQPTWSEFPGALVKVKMESTVGVLLDDIPEDQREKLTQSLIDKSQDFWLDRAKRQIRLTSMKLNFRNNPPKKQLPLPPEDQWKIELTSDPERTTKDGHDVVMVNYSFSGILLTDKASPGLSEPALKNIGGQWDEPFLLPVDPELIFQRTGFACMNEAQFPPNSMDAEESDLFYDDRCKVEKKLSNLGCHQTQMPTMSCTQAVQKNIGKVETAMRFEHLAWDAALADQVRTGTFTTVDGPDLAPDKEEFMNHRFTYRYIPQDSCTLVENCVGGSGWRKLLMFPTADLNSGTQPLEIGVVDYFLEENGSVLSKHGLFELSDCHGHYHFSHYGSFTLGDGSLALTRKNGFCMQPTARLMNNELSPLNHPYVDCIDQGVSVGWIDEYKMGLECQWVDVTEVKPNQELPLSFTTNPDGLLCEGKLKRDAEGNQLFEPTHFKTSEGEPVDKPQCDFSQNWAKNNTESYPVVIPDVGESYVTAPCRDGLFGKLRNCGFKQTDELNECKPGTKVTLTCTTPANSPAQVVRVCEGSRALQSGIPCTYNEALGSTIVVESQKDVSFTCPTARDEIETGGVYSFMTGPLFPSEKTAPVSCVVKVK